ncbi:MAG: hypothetical protein SFX73_23595 [Kofleriaceae bacterium]|nr:hypothetical protein [Kofleriaceae bacterium]
MCCFSVQTPAGLIARWFPRKVHVSATNIFARMTAPGAQALAYGMNLETDQEVAMVLPLPVVPGSGDDAVTFVDLSAHPRMFEQLSLLFDVPPPQSRSANDAMPRLAMQPTLVVHAIGSFVASYVPTRADFTRLDPRFRLPEVLFDAVPHYHDYGFAVFQLARGNVTVHPMAMTFPTRDPQRLFFPTVHVHDGRWKAKAGFDHALYYQTPRRTQPGVDQLDGDNVSWLAPTESFADLVVPKQAMVRRTLRGSLPNTDTWVAA